jgi:crotonobetainyl-CoA:carnitine CoA-transferase CaiB-like acyl-CoA transferase
MTSGFLRDMWTSLGGQPEDTRAVSITEGGNLPSVFAVTQFASASVGAAALAVAELIAARHGGWPAVKIDHRLASLWFSASLRPDGWPVPPPWDPVAGDYRTSGGWIRLHTNTPPHRKAALAVLGVAAEKDAVAKAVSGWTADALETAIAAAGGCGAAMRTETEWATHPQGRAVAAEPLLHIAATAAGPPPSWTVPRDRPLRGIRVLDLTRVLAGPVATRFLAGFGADVLRVDPPWWEEPALVPEMTLGKRCARLDLRDQTQKTRFLQLLAETDVIVHGYRPDALARLGVDAARRQAVRPGLIDVSLDAYGWTGPWAGRRGFDSLVQMSAGIAEAGMREMRRDRPTPLPVQALDHATGYLMAAAAIRGVTQRLRAGHGAEVRTSLARVAAVLVAGRARPDAEAPAPEGLADLSEGVEATAWGPARRLRPPAAIAGTPLTWDRAASPLGSSDPVWPH